MYNRRLSREVSVGNVKIGGNCIIIDTDAHNIDYITRRKPATDWGGVKPDYYRR